jgi:hypothetical protein
MKWDGWWLAHSSALGLYAKGDHGVGRRCPCLELRITVVTRKVLSC